MHRFYSLAALLGAALVFAPTVAAQQATPGTYDSAKAAADVAEKAAMPLDPTVAETGLISASIDGCGSNNSSCTVNVEKPAGATVRRAFLASSTFGFVIPDGGITINGTGVNWDETASVSFLRSFGADVTAIVKPIVDAAAAGTVALTVGEGSSTSIDGSSVVVIFDDPNVTTTSTVVIAFGGQQLTGDTFNITLGTPFDDASQDITMSLAIGFGYQVGGGGQRSFVDVNGTRISSSAGGQDDCEGANAAFSNCPNGTLYTVGGLGDDPANPADPNAGPTNPRTDDELYTLDPFIDDGDTQITVFSQNPSNDDLVHMAVFVIKGSAAIVGEGILLTPDTATNPVNTDHTVTALVQDNDGNPVSGRSVEFEVLSGPNAGLTASATTNGSGNATFTFSSSVAGTDVVVARFEDSQGNTVTSNQVTKVWVAEEGPLACTPEAPLSFTAFDIDAVGDPRGEFAELTNGATEDDVDLAGCDFIVFDPFSEDVTYAADATGVLAPGGTHVWANNSGDQPLPMNSFVDTPGGAFALIQGSASVGDDVLDVLAAADVVAAVVYLGDESTFGSVGGGATAADNAAALADALALLGGTVAAENGPDGVFALRVAPNPVASGATVSFELAEGADVRLAVYDALGREVATLADGPFTAGLHSARLDATALPAGVYLARLAAGADVQTVRLTITR